MKLRILLVDDDKSVRALLRNQLLLEDYFM